MTKHCRQCGRFMGESRMFRCEECAKNTHVPSVILDELIREGYIKKIKQRGLTDEELDILNAEQLRQYDSPCLKDFYDAEYIDEINAVKGPREIYVDQVTKARRESDPSLGGDWGNGEGE